ncbi:MAG: M23 family metallopeptidase [Deltaproteobacteria bacterium]|nr:M23 family metallopeptidase [Deltaproteobacteria bacterium]
MKSNRLTVIIQPDWHTGTRKLNAISTLQFPKRVVYFLTLGVVLLIGFGLSGSLTIQDNITIRTQIASLEQDLTRLSAIVNEVDRIRSDEKIVRESLGIEVLDKDYDINERLGRGGAEPEEDDVLYMNDLDLREEIGKPAESRPLHVRVYDLRDDVHELLQALSKMKVTLLCRPTIMPVKDKEIWITSGFGWRKSPFTGLRQFHKGLDISGRKGSDLCTTADGVVIKVGYNRFIGKYIKVKHDERFTTMYGHMWKYNVKKGDDVKRGDVIGFMGSSGMSTGYHVHYEVVDNGKKVNPYNFVLNRHERSLASTH